MKTKKKYLLLSFLMFLVVLSPMSANAAAKVKLSKTKVTLTAGKSTTLTLKNNKKKVTWSSSNKKVATVNSKGKVSAKKQGTARITAKVGTKKYTCKVTVKASAKITLSKTKVTLREGKSTTLKVKNTTSKVTWSSSNKKVATVNSKGKVTAKKKGSATITVKTKDGGKKATCKVTVVGTYDEQTQGGDQNDSNACKLYGHSWGPQVINVMPTCAKEGSCTYTCYWCGKVKTETLPKRTVHTWQATSHHTPTQKENWICDTVKCTVCGVTDEVNCLNPGAKGHPDYWTLAGGEAEALNRIKLYRQNQDKIHDPNNDLYSSCNGWAVELMTYIWQVDRFSISTKNGQPYGGGCEPGLQYYDASTIDPLYDLRVGDAIHNKNAGNYYTDKDGNRVKSGHWIVITDIQRDASGKMIRYRWADCGEMNSVLHGIPRWCEDYYWITGPYGSYWLEGYEGGYCDASSITRNWGTSYDQIMTMWPDIWTKIQ